ncbi:unnamed protein product, partial [Mesorhabditis belari]|uniref:Uncharacterized protein n=1 Tax=Mesorhabditis belari TaxID=2138241 RepID=A0AAF3F5T3_9BILA
MAVPTAPDWKYGSNVCDCGDYCVSYHFQFCLEQDKKKYYRQCGCMFDPSRKTESKCDALGEHDLNGELVYCCSGDRCNADDLYDAVFGCFLDIPHFLNKHWYSLLSSISIDIVYTHLTPPHFAMIGDVWSIQFSGLLSFLNVDPMIQTVN